MAESVDIEELDGVRRSPFGVVSEHQVELDDDGAERSARQG